MSSAPSRPPLKAAALILLGLAAACTSRSDSRSAARSDSGDEVAAAAASDSMSSSTPRDTNMSGMSDMDTTGNPDQQFLRMISDHHKGMLVMARDALQRQGVSVKSEAQKMDKEQDTELSRMLSMLKSDFKDPYTPKVMPDNQAMVESLKGKSGAAYDTTFRENVIKHHEQAIQMIDEFLPKLTRPELKQMAQKMKSAQTREIAQLKRELGQT